MKEVGIFDLFKCNEDEKFCGGIFLTYNFEAEVFEKYLLPAVFNIDTDSDENYSRFRYEVSQKLRQAPIIVVGDGCHYSGGKTFLYDLKLADNLTFHPKVFILLYESYMRVIIGSSNITKSGLCYNAELIWYQDFYLDKKYSQAFELMNFIIDLNKVVDISNNNSYEKILKFLNQCSIERDDYPKIVTTLSNDSILNQLIDTIKKEDKIVKEINIVSPFFETDRKKAIDNSLIMDFYKSIEPYINNKTKINFFFSGRKEGSLNKWVVDVPLNIMKELNKLNNINYNVISPYWENGNETYSRQLHGKLIYITLEKGQRVYLMGSPNFTLSAMKSNKKNLNNIEVGVIEVSKQKLDIPKYETVKFSDLIINEKSEEDIKFVNFIKSVRYIPGEKSYLEVNIDVDNAPNEFSLFYNNKEILSIKDNLVDKKIIQNFKLKIDQDIYVLCSYPYYIPIFVENKHLVNIDSQFNEYKLNLRDIINYYAKNFRNPSEFNIFIKNKVAISGENGFDDVVVSFKENLQSFFKALHALDMRLSEPYYDMEAFLYELNQDLGVVNLIDSIIKTYEENILPSIESYFYLLEIRQTLINLKFKEDKISYEKKIGEIYNIINKIDNELNVIGKGMNSKLKKQLNILKASYGGNINERY